MQPQAISVAGCEHVTVGPIVRGTFQLTSTNHGRPVYTKTEQANGLNVMLYFWDDRDGPEFSGWYFGMEVGGDQVWAHHADRLCSAPPATGWKVPFGGPGDPTLTVTPAADASPAPQQVVQEIQQYMGLHQTQPQTVATAIAQPVALTVAQPLAVASVQPAQQLVQVMDPATQLAQQQAQMLQLQQQQMLQYQQAALQQHQLAQQQQLMQMAALQQQAAQAAERQRQDELRKVRELEMAKKRAADKATMAIMSVVNKLRTASVENFEALCKELDEVLEKELHNTGAQKERLAAQAESGKVQAERMVELVKQRRKQHEEMVAMEEKRRRDLDERAQTLLEELEKLLADAQTHSRQLAELVGPLESSSKPEGGGLTNEQVQATARAVELFAKGAAQLSRMCTIFTQEKAPELSSLGSSLAMPPRFVNLKELVTNPTEIGPKLKGLMQEAEELEKAAKAAIDTSTAAGDAAGRRIRARLATDGLRASFERYDHDGDKMLSASEVRSYAKGEFDFVVPQADLDSIWKNLVHEDPTGKKLAGVGLDMFQHLKVHIGVAREVARDRIRKAENLETEKALVGMIAAVEARLPLLATMVANAGVVVVRCEEEVRELQQKAKGMTMDDAERQAASILQRIQGARSSWSTARAAIDGLGDVEKRYRPGIHAFLAVKAKRIEIDMGRLGLRLVRVTNLTRRFPERIRLTQVRKERRRRRADEAARAAEEAERDVDLQIEEHIRQLELAAMAAADALPPAAEPADPDGMMQALLAETATDV